MSSTASVSDQDRMTYLAKIEEEAAVIKTQVELNLMICQLMILRLSDPTSDPKLHFLKDLLSQLKEKCVELFNVDFFNNKFDAEHEIDEYY